MNTQTETPEPYRFKLWKYLADNHGLTLLESELHGIVQAVESQLERELNDAKQERDSLLARMDECGYQEMLAKQNELKAKLTELLAIAEELSDKVTCDCSDCESIKSMLTTFKQ
jgi:hypothetical protein